MNAPRKREFLLSLKYATIEACFSVPMLNLTRANLPFVIGFVATALGWDASTIGLMVAIPLFCHVIQPLVTHTLQRFFSLREIVLMTFAFNSLPWALVAWFPWLEPHTKAWLMTIVFVSSLADSVSSVSWWAAMSDLVPVSIRGRYFGDRNLIFAFWTLVSLLAAGQFVDHHGNTLTAFGIVFATAAGGRMIGMYYFARMRFPKSVTEKRPQTRRLSEYFDVVRDHNYLRLLLFVGLWGFSLNLALPFYNVYVLKRLPYSVGDLALLATISSLGGLISLRSWGPLSDRFGSKPVMVTCSILWAATAGLSWLVCGPERHAHLYLNYFITGFMTSGFQLCQWNLMINLVPAQRKSQYISVFFAFTNLFTALGPLTGAALLHQMPEQVGSLLGQPLTKFHVLFVGSAILCLLSVHVLQSLREPAERPLRELMRVMQNMREFNPVLGLTTLAEYMFTPRGIMRLATRSVRTLRRQTHAMSDVGEDLVEGGWRALQQPFRRPPSAEPEQKKDVPPAPGKES